VLVLRARLLALNISPDLVGLQALILQRANTTLNNQNKESTPGRNGESAPPHASALCAVAAPVRAPPPVGGGGGVGGLLGDAREGGGGKQSEAPKTETVPPFHLGDFFSGPHEPPFILKPPIHRRPHQAA
jgi:hypothetical protein